MTSSVAVNRHRDIDEIKYALSPEDYLTRLGREHRRTGRELYFPCEFHPDGKRGNLRIDTDKQTWYCDVCEVGGDLIELAGRRLHGSNWSNRDVDQIKATLNHLREVAGLPTPVAVQALRQPVRREELVATYNYDGADSRLVYQAVRYESVDEDGERHKRFLLRRPNGRGGYIYDMEATARLPYNLPEIVAADINELVYVVEGEKCADELIKRNVLVTTNSEGALKWRPEINEYFRDRIVVIIPDHDEKGHKHAEHVASQLYDVAAAVYILELPGLPKKGDIVEWFAAGGTVEELKALTRSSSRPWQPQSEEVGDTTPSDGTAAGHIATDSNRFNLTDLGNAERLIAREGGDLRYCYPWKCWLVWDGKRYRRDDTGEVERRAKRTVRSMYAEAADIEDDKQRNELINHARRSEAGSRIRALIDLAQSETGVPVGVQELDPNPWLLNVSNGTLDLRTGQLLPHNREHLITKLAPVNYDHTAQCPTWLSHLERIMLGRPAVISYLQRALGYSLTGTTGEQVMMLWHGLGANGKSVTLELIRTLLGDYAMHSPTETLMVKRGDAGVPNDIARLAGARFVSAVEAEDGKRLAESLVKQVTGGDPITARFMRAEWFEFVPTFKLFLATNHKPVIRGSDYAIWRRIQLVPFDVTIPEGERDCNIKDKLLAEASGILAWLVRGCLAWKDQGLAPPDVVTAATQEYRADMDVLATFIEDRCTEAHTAKVTAKALYKAYTEWCEENGERPESQRRLGSRLRERGFEPGKGGGNAAVWHGLGLQDEPQQAGLER